MKKRSVASLIALIFAFVFVVGCSTNSVSDISSDNINQSEQDASQHDSVSELSTESNIIEQGKSAVVYFSATGNTAEAAQIIANETGADIFEIVPQEVYTSDDLNYNDDNCRANQEMNDDNARPAIADNLSVVSEYDRIYLGYPIWWGTAPRIIQTFLEEYDLSQATIYIFCTSGGSGVEQSVRDLQSLYPDTNIIEGKRFSSASAEDVKSWIESLN